jgi:hypothetical protein
MRRRQDFGVPRSRYGMGDLESVDSVIAEARQRSDSRQNISVPSVLDLNLRYCDPHPGQPKGGYMARIDGKDLPLSDNALRGACKMMNAQWRHYRQFADPSAFPQALHNILDNPGRRGPKGLLVRTGLADNGINEEVAAIMSPTYRIRDAWEQLTDFSSLINDTIGTVRGIDRIEYGHGNELSYRIVIGNNVMQATDELHGQFMMFVLSMSELGVGVDTTTLGLYRLVCTNGAMALTDKSLVSRWNHQGSADKYLEKSSESLRHLGFLGDQWGKIFGELMSAPLTADASDMLHAFREAGYIDNDHFDAAQSLAVTGPVETQFELYNLLTRSAQDLASIKARQQAESKSFRLFTEEGGIVEKLRKAVGLSGEQVNTP